VIAARRKFALAVVCGALLASREAAADPDPPDAPAGTTYLHLVHGGHLTTPGGADLTLPPGYYVDAGSWDRLDAEVHRLQDAETRLTAEEASLEASAHAGGAPGWVYAAAGLVVGALAGAAYVHYR
jgi:hypothetical protein